MLHKFVSVSLGQLHKAKKLLACTPYPQRGSADASVLIVGAEGRIPQSQIFPFQFYGLDFLSRSRFSVEVCDGTSFLGMPDSQVKNIDIVVVQVWGYDANQWLASFKKAADAGCIVVAMDATAPSDLRYAPLLDEYCDLYVKKHPHSNDGEYGKALFGDTNLTDYCAKRFSIDLAPTQYEMPVGFLNKLMVGPSFLTADYMLPYFFYATKPLRLAARYDVLGRLASHGDRFYQAMRSEAITALEAVDDVTSLIHPGASHGKYLLELSQSKLCFSPFGYGEVSWRDYEAVMCGSLLLKPNMDHVKTFPNIFIPYETYIPLAWDYSDLAEKVHYYLENESERIRITQQAYSVVHEYCRSCRFVEDFSGAWTSLLNMKSHVHH